MYKYSRNTDINSFYNNLKPCLLVTILCCGEGCDCDESLPNADDFCPRDQVCTKGRFSADQYLCFALTSSLSVNAWRRAVSATQTPSTQMSSVAPRSNVSTVSVYLKVILVNSIGIF